MFSNKDMAFLVSLSIGSIALITGGLLFVSKRVFKELNKTCQESLEEASNLVLDVKDDLFEKKNIKRVVHWFSK